MRIEGRKNGKVTSGTVRDKNFKNQTVWGKKAIQSMEAKGKKGALKKNWHASIGGKSHKLNSHNIYLEAHEDIDDQLADAREELDALMEQEKIRPLTKDEKQTLKHIKHMFSDEWNP